MYPPVPTDVHGITLVDVADHEHFERVPFVEEVFFLVPKCRHRRGVHLQGKPRLISLARTAMISSAASYVIITSGTYKQSKSKTVSRARRQGPRKVANDEAFEEIVHDRRSSTQ